jgi:hypothetical protein
VTKAHKVTACQGVFKRSLSIMETYAINGVLNIGVEKKIFQTILIYKPCGIYLKGVILINL